MPRRNQVGVGATRSEYLVNLFKYPLDRRGGWGRSRPEWDSTKTPVVKQDVSFGVRRKTTSSTRVVSAEGEAVVGGGWRVGAPPRDSDVDLHLPAPTGALRQSVNSNLTRRDIDDPWGTGVIGPNPTGPVAFGPAPRRDSRGNRDQGRQSPPVSESVNNWSPDPSSHGRDVDHRSRETDSQGAVTVITSLSR